jgi:hypothetical protein
MRTQKNEVKSAPDDPMTDRIRTDETTTDKTPADGTITDKLLPLETIMDHSPARNSRHDDSVFETDSQIRPTLESLSGPFLLKGNGID